MSYIFEMQGVQKNFGGVCAIDNINLQLEAGTIHGLIGPNGAGKTTIFNCITGIYKPEKGRIFFGGREITKFRPDQVAKAGIARTFQNIRLFSNLSVLENVIIAGNVEARYSMIDAFLRTSRYQKATKEVEEKALELLDLVDLAGYRDARADSLPYGHQRRLEIARAMALNPGMLLLDEPAAGMNADEEKELIEFIQNIKERFDLTILLIEHHMDVIANLCRNCTVLDFGKMLVSGTPEKVKSDPLVIEAYLGGPD